MTQDGLFSEKQHHLKIRCPNCFKLYSVDSSEIKEAKPRFQCVSCEQRFWVPFPEALEQAAGLIGFPLEWIETSTPQAQMPDVATQATAALTATLTTTPTPEVSLPLQTKAFQCPKCREPYSGGDTECSSCGIVFAKFVQPDLTSAFQVSRDLKNAWDDVIQAYEDYDVHRRFIRLAQVEQSLEYALERYKIVLDACPQDDLAMRAQKELVALAEVKIQVQEEAPRKNAFEFQFPRLRLGTFLMFLCAVVMVMGLMIPGARNLVGFGSAVLFVMLALRFYFRIL